MIVFRLPPRLLGKLGQDYINRHYTTRSRRTESIECQQRDAMSLQSGEPFIPMLV